MSDSVVVALIVGSFTIMGPLILGWYQYRALQKAKLQDYAHQELLSAIATNKLDLIQNTVTSKMSQTMQAELDSTIRELVVIREVAALHRAAGNPIDYDAIVNADVAKRRIHELTSILADRAENLKQQLPQQTDGQDESDKSNEVLPTVTNS